METLLNSWNYLTEVNYEDSTTGQEPDRVGVESMPFDVRNEFLEEYLEVGQNSLSEEYFKGLLDTNEYIAQNLIQTIYYDSVKFNRRKSSWNIMVVLSQLPYSRIKPWASFVALAATRNPYYEIQELGIRCFENWEDMDACSFLQNCKFSESWLQDYADEVVEFVLEEGKANVLCEKNQSWKMAGGEEGGGSDSEGYRSGYGNNRTEDKREYAFHMAG